MRLWVLSIFLCISLLSTSAQDVAVYEAKGPVKQIKWVRTSDRAFPIPYFYGTQNFDRCGRVKDFDKRYYAKRDRKGRMKREGMDPTDAYEWHYDKKGRMIWLYYLERGDYAFYSYIIYPFYTASGEVGKYRIHEGELSDIRDMINELTVNITERDHYGNWIRRSLTSSVGKQVFNEKRIITYYK